MSSRAEQKAAARAAREQAEQSMAQQAARRRRLTQLGAVLAAAAAIVAVLVFISSSGTDDKPKRKAGETVAGQAEVAARFAGLPQDGIAIGRKDAPVTVVEFADMQCPFCADFARDGLPAVLEDVRAGTARIEFRGLAFIGDDSERMARVLAAAGAQDKTWPVLDLMYINQGRENSGYATDEFLRSILGAVDGLDVEKVLSDRSGAAATKALDDAKTLAQQSGIDSTPSFLIGKTGGAMKTLDVTNLDGTQIRAAIKKLAG